MGAICLKPRRHFYFAKRGHFYFAAKGVYLSFVYRSGDVLTFAARSSLLFAKVSLREMIIGPTQSRSTRFYIIGLSSLRLVCGLDERPSAHSALDSLCLPRFQPFSNVPVAAIRIQDLDRVNTFLIHTRGERIPCQP